MDVITIVRGSSGSAATPEPRLAAHRGKEGPAGVWKSPSSCLPQWILLTEFCWGLLCLSSQMVSTCALTSVFNPEPPKSVLHSPVPPGWVLTKRFPSSKPVRHKHQAKGKTCCPWTLCYLSPKGSALCLECKGRNLLLLQSVSQKE